jgi:tRNA-splicing ligase RtcB
LEPSLRGGAEEAPDAYKDVGKVVDAADEARLDPLICVKG